MTSFTNSAFTVSTVAFHASQYQLCEVLVHFWTNFALRLSSAIQLLVQPC